MIVYKEESYQIVGVAFEVYNQIFYKGEELRQTYRADFVCYGKILIELKAVSELVEFHYAQVYNYLHSTNIKLGLLFNFGGSNGLEKDRIVL